MKRVVFRLFDIFAYTFITWLTFYFIAKADITHDFNDAWSSIRDSIHPHYILLVYYLAGLLTKNILIHSGDYKCQHSFLNEERYRFKDSSIISTIERFNLKLKLKQLIKNPPLRLAILFYILIIYFTNEKPLKEYAITENIFYILGYVTPIVTSVLLDNIRPIRHTIDSDYNQKQWYQNEQSIFDLSQDNLNRGGLVRRLYNIITSNKFHDTRGIAIIGSYGIGKSSVINMTMTQIELQHYNFIKCRVNSWGTYSSEEQIQKFIIEKIIDSLGQITSTTRLSGLPSKYIHTLKGAQSLWLDILPLFENHSSAFLQLKEINDILDDLNLKLILIVEDLDRNKDASSMLNSIAPLIDTLNHHNNFRFIMSIGEKLNDPDITTRICRYTEFITFDRTDIYQSIYQSISEMIQEHKGMYFGDIKEFFSLGSNQTNSSIVRNALFSYILSPRELKYIIRMMKLYWDDYLYGCCDILDLLAITIVKRYEPILISTFAQKNPNSISFDELEKNNDTFSESLVSRSNTIAIVTYFFDTTDVDRRPKNRLQSCKYDFAKYYNIMVEKKEITVEEREYEQSYFRNLDLISQLCDEKHTCDEIKYVILDAIKHRGVYQFISDYNALHSKNALIPVLILILAHIEKNEAMIFSSTEYLLKESKNLSAKNYSLTRNITHQIAKSLLTHDIQKLKSIYSAIATSIPNRFISKPSVNDLMETLKGCSVKNIKLGDMYLIRSMIELRLNNHENAHKLRNYIFIKWLLKDNSSSSIAIIEQIKNYKISDYHSTENEFKNELKDALNELRGEQDPV